MEINEETNSLESTEESNEKIQWLDYATLYHADGRKCEDGNLATASSRITEATDITADDFFEPRFQETPSPGIADEFIDGDLLMEINEEANSLGSAEECNEEIPWLDYAALYHADGRKCEEKDLPARKIEIMEELRMISETVQGMIEAAPQDESVLIQSQKTDVQKIKVDCPHCKKKVTAVRFVPHLSKCLGNGGRKCTHRKKRSS